MSIMEKLTEGIVNRNLQKEGAALLRKWNQTGLLEGLNESAKQNMAVLLENQAKSLLKESTNGMAGGEIEGFAAVAFPIVRRVFAGLIANDLVSVQPMSLPSGLIFFLDFKFDRSRTGAVSGDSIYGQGVLGSEITGGVSLASAELDKQPYSFGSAYSSPTGSITTAVVASATWTINLNGYTAPALVGGASFDASAVDFDPDLLVESNGKYLVQISTTWSSLEASGYPLNKKHVSQIVLPLNNIDSSTLTQVRRLNKISADGLTVTFTYVASAQLTDAAVDADIASTTGGHYPNTDKMQASATNDLGAIVAGSTWALEGNPNMPEIDIKVDSIAITAQTKKLKAKWTPELGQDLNAYHNIDAEVELTSILSEQIALEIDREILADLVNGATAGKFYWSRSPGLFVNRATGAEVGASAKAPDFTGTVSEWYETLIETINDVSAQIHRKTLRGGATHVVCGPEVANILEFTAGFRANVTADADKGDIGAVKVGSLNKKFEVIVDPYFPRNVILVSRIGKSFLESGYVYAPYVPLQTTPTIFGTEDFVPRKGVMTRYGKKMVRPDMYGLVIVRGLLGESGGT